MAVTTVATNWLDHTNLIVYLVNSSRSTKYRVACWSAIDIAKEEHDFGALTITAPVNAPWITNAAGTSFDPYTGWERWSFDVYIRGMTTPEWSGPIITRAFTAGPSLHGEPTVTFTAVTFCQHFLSRRRNNTATYADVATTDYPEDLIRIAYRNACGDVTPTGYPGGVNRSDFGTGWTVDGAADVGTVSPTIAKFEQEGNLLLDYCRDVADKGDCYLYASETSAATWSLTTARPYQDTDTTASFVLTPVRGSVTSWRLEHTVADLINVAGIKGDGSNTGQVKGYQSDATSIASRGVFEGEGTLPAASSTTYTDTEATRMVELYAEPTETIEIAARDVSGAQFYGQTAGSTYGLRDLLRFYIPPIDTTVDAVLRGYRIAQSGEGPVSVDLTLGNIRVPVHKQVFDGAGYMGRRLTGGRWRNNDG